MENATRGRKSALRWLVAGLAVVALSVGAIVAVTVYSHNAAQRENDLLKNSAEGWQSVFGFPDSTPTVPRGASSDYSQFQPYTRTFLHLVEDNHVVPSSTSIRARLHLGEIVCLQMKQGYSDEYITEYFTRRYGLTPDGIADVLGVLRYSDQVCPDVTFDWRKIK